MESRVLFSVCDVERTVMEFRGPFLRVSVSKVSGPVSVWKATGLETLNIAKTWFSKASILQRFLFVVFADKKQPKQVGKCQKIEKNSA